MARSVANEVLDAALNYIADNCDRMDLCNAEPTTYTEATATFSLANTTLALTTAGADYAIADGDVSGRKLTVSAQTGISVGTTGTVNHLALTDGTAALIYVTTVTAQAVSSGGTADTSAFDIEIEDPAAP